MCLPVAILAVQAAAAVASAVGAADAARRNAHQAQDATTQSYGALQDQRIQLDAQSTDQMNERSKQAMRDAGTLNNIFADSGLSGNTQERLANESAATASQDITTMERSRAAGISQTGNEASAMRARAQSQVNQVRQPSLIGTGLQIAGAALDYGKNTGFGRTPPSP